MWHSIMGFTWDISMTPNSPYFLSLFPFYSWPEASCIRSWSYCGKRSVQLQGSHTRIALTELVHLFRMASDSLHFHHLSAADCKTTWWLSVSLCSAVPSSALSWPWVKMLDQLWHRYWLSDPAWKRKESYPETVITWGNQCSWDSSVEPWLAFHSCEEDMLSGTWTHCIRQFSSRVGSAWWPEDPWLWSVTVETPHFIVRTAKYLRVWTQNRAA